MNQARSEALGKQWERQAAVQEAQEQAALEGMSYTERFSKELDAWDGQTKGKEFTVGHTSDVLLSLGVPDADINLLSDKILKIQKKHPAMTDAVIRQIPEIVENPVVVMKSRTVADRLTLFGEVMDANGAPVLAVIDTNLKAKDGNVDVEVVRLNSAYGKDTDAQSFIDRSEILYVDKNRAESWSDSTRLYLPIAPDPLSSADSIPQSAETVNSSISDSAVNDSGQGNSSQGIGKSDIKRLAESPNPRTVQTNNATGASSSKKVKSPVDTTKQLAKALNVGQDIGSRKVPRGVQGFYNDRAKYIAVRSTEAGNISTIMHEIGHAIADRLDMLPMFDTATNSLSCCCVPPFCSPCRTCPSQRATNLPENFASPYGPSPM